MEAAPLLAAVNVSKFKDQREEEDRILSMFNNPQFDEERKQATLELLAILTELIVKHPEQRFSQILRNYGFVRETRPIKAERGEMLGVDWKNEFSLEPVELLKRVKRRKNDIENPEGSSTT